MKFKLKEGKLTDEMQDELFNLCDGFVDYRASESKNWLIYEEQCGVITVLNKPNLEIYEVEMIFEEEKIYSGKLRKRDNRWVVFHNELIEDPQHGHAMYDYKEYPLNENDEELEASIEEYGLPKMDVKFILENNYAKIYAPGS